MSRRRYVHKCQHAPQNHVNGSRAFCSSNARNTRVARQRRYVKCHHVTVASTAPRLFNVSRRQTVRRCRRCLHPGRVGVGCHSAAGQMSNQHGRTRGQRGCRRHTRQTKQPRHARSGTTVRPYRRPQKKQRVTRHRWASARNNNAAPTNRCRPAFSLVCTR